MAGSRGRALQVLRKGRELLAYALQLSAELLDERLLEGVVSPAALAVRAEHRLGVRPQLDAVAADAYRLPGDVGSGIRRQVGDQAGHVIGRAEAEVVTEEGGHRLALRVSLDGRGEVRHG